MSVTPAPQQLVGYWNPTLRRFEGPGGVPDGALVDFSAKQDTGVTETIALGVAPRAGFVSDVRVAAITPLGTPDTYTVDIKQNGTTILSAPMALLSSTAARASVVGALAASPTAVAAGDFFEADVTYTHSSGTAPASVVIGLTLTLN